MAINFTKNVEQYTTANKTTRVKHFTEFGSKKQLEDAGVLGAEELAFAMSLKGTFNYALHEGKRYMAVTLYKVNGAERKYNFLVLDLQEKAVAEANSIREAKNAILELVEQDVQNAVKEILDAELANTEPAETEPTDLEEASTTEEQGDENAPSKGKKKKA